MTKKLPYCTSVLSMNTSYIGFSGLHSETNYRSVARRTALNNEFLKKLTTINTSEFRERRKHAKTKQLLESSMLAYTERMRQINRRRMSLPETKEEIVIDRSDSSSSSTDNCSYSSSPDISSGYNSWSVSIEYPSTSPESEIQDRNFIRRQPDQSFSYKQTTIFPLTEITVRKRGHSVTEGCLDNKLPGKVYKTLDSIPLPLIGSVCDFDFNRISVASPTVPQNLRHLSSENCNLHRRSFSSTSPFPTISEESSENLETELLSNEE